MATARLSSIIELGPGAGGALPTEFRIFSAGVVSSDHGDFLFDGRSADLVMQAAREHGADFSIDYDHSAMLTERGVKSVAAGWFTLEVRGGELWATRVKWTDIAAAHLRALEYRYFSPLFNHTPEGRITRLVNVALTNTPALHGLAPLMAAASIVFPSTTYPRPGDHPMTNVVHKLQSLSYHFTADGGLVVATANGELTYSKERVDFLKKSGHGPGDADFEAFMNHSARDTARKLADPNLPQEQRTAMSQTFKPITLGR